MFYTFHASLFCGLSSKMPRAGMGGLVIGIIVSIVAIAVGSVVGLALIGQSWQIGMTLPMPSAAVDALNSTATTITTIWPLLGLVALAIIGAAVLIALGVFGAGQ